MMSELSLFFILCERGCWVGDSVAGVEDEFRFGNIPAVMFVNVKVMKEFVR